MPKGAYDRSVRKEPKPASKIKTCQYCGREVIVRAKNSKAVCYDWICQNKERLRQANTRYDNIKKRANNV